MFSSQKENGEAAVEEPKPEVKTDFPAPEAPEAPVENQNASPFQANDFENRQ